MLGRLEDVPLTTKYEHQEKQSCAEFDDVFALAYQSGSIGYYFGNPKDHMSTPSIPTEERRKELAEEGKETIQVLVERMNVPHIAEQMKIWKHIIRKLQNAVRGFLLRSRVDRTR